jgi:2-hydroxymuconate-semialdehyde hydrolase
MNAALDVTSITIDDADRQYRFHLTRSGPSGAPVILWLHGSGPGVTAMSNWAGMLETFASDHHSLAPDIIGFGDSTHPDPPPPGRKAFTELRARTLLRLLDALGIERAHVVGNSMGGVIALVMAEMAPARIDRMVLMGSGGAPVAPTPELRRLVSFYDDPTAGHMATLMHGFVHDPSAFGDDLERIARERLPMALRDDVRRSHLATFAPGGDPLAFPPERLAAIGTPTLVLHGASDRVIPVAASEYLAAHLPRARRVVLEQAGHWLQIEQPQAFVRQLRAFLAY